MSPVFDGKVNAVTLSDKYGEYCVYMLPFVKPVTVRRFFGDKKIGSYTEEDLVLLKPNFIKEAIEKKKNDKKNAEYQQQLEKVIEQSKSESENTDKRYKEAENNLKKIIPEGYRVTSFDKGDEIIGDGNCFYRAIAKLEKGNQEEYGDVRKKIFDEIGKYCPESNEEQAEKSTTILKILLRIMP